MRKMGTLWDAMTIGAAPRQWLHRLLGYYMWRANATRDPRYWYPLKDELLRRFGLRDGWDRQIFECWGSWYQAREEGLDRTECQGARCWHCDGQGVYREVALLRWLVGGRLFHSIADRTRRSDGEPRRTIRGLIEHPKARKRAPERALWVLLVVFRPHKARRRLVQRVGFLWSLRRNRILRTWRSVIDRLRGPVEISPEDDIGF